MPQKESLPVNALSIIQKPCVAIPKCKTEKENFRQLWVQIQPSFQNHTLVANHLNYRD
jgi:hypothetical protein